MTPLLAQKSRSDRGFERMYRRHVGDVYRYALAVMRNPIDAEDVTQTTFLNAYRAYVEKGNRPEKPQNWLIAIAHNVCRQRFRQSARRPAEVTFEDDIASTIVVDDDTPSGEDIRRALSHLAFNQRAALIMRELEGRSYGEIAEILDVSTSAVETLIFRARRALREQLEGSLTCGEAEFAISRQLDGRLPRPEKSQLRAHLRECAECARFARSQRAQRTALKSLGLIPVPTSLASFFGGGGAAVGTGLALKAAAAVTAGLVIGGAGYEGVRHAPWQAQQSAVAAPGTPRGDEAGLAKLDAIVPQGAREAAKAARRHAAAAKSGNAKPGKTKAAGAQRGQGRQQANSSARAATQQAGKKAKKQHSTGRGHQKTTYAGDASVAARHVKVHPAQSHASPARPPQAQAAKPKPQPALPGPFDAGPPGNEKGKNK
jgi:RNA polymerase sigma factor (sigma-70 family)